MARGWESKSIESQIEDAAGDLSPNEKYLTPAERERDQRRKSLALSRARIESQLRATTSAAHRQALEHALAHLDEELTKLG